MPGPNNIEWWCAVSNEYFFQNLFNKIPYEKSRWDWWIVPKYQYGIATTRCIKTQESAYHEIKLVIFQWNVHGSLETVSTRCWLQCHFTWWRNCSLFCIKGCCLRDFEQTSNTKLCMPGLKMMYVCLTSVKNERRLAWTEYLFFSIIASGREVFPEKPHITLSVPRLWNDVSSVEISQQYRALHLMNKAIFLLYFGCCSRDLPGMSCITLCMPWL